MAIKTHADRERDLRNRGVLLEEMTAAIVAQVPLPFPSYSYVQDLTATNDTLVSAVPTLAYLGDLVLVRITSTAAVKTVTWAAKFKNAAPVVTSGVAAQQLVVVFFGLPEADTWLEVTRTGWMTP